MISLKIPTSVWILGLGGAGLLGYYLFKKKEFPFNEGSIFNELKQDLSNLQPGAPQGPPPPPMMGGGGAGAPDEGVTPGTIQSNPQAVDLATYQNYLQGLKMAFPDYVPNISSTTGQVIAGDPNLFQNNNINGPPIQPYPGGALMPPYTQQMYPYYRPPMPGQPPMMGPPPMMPQGPPPWQDPFFEYDVDKYGRRRRKYTQPKPTASTPTPTQDDCVVRVGSICIKRGGGISMGSGSSGSSGGGGISVGNGGISVGGLMQGGNLGNIFGNSGLGNNVNTNQYGIGTSANSQVIKGQVNSMLDDIFAKVGISR